MIMIFTDEEKEWLVTEPNNWHIKNGCPKRIKESLEKKLLQMKNFSDKLKEMSVECITTESNHEDGK